MNLKERVHIKTSTQEYKEGMDTYPGILIDAIVNEKEVGSIGYVDWNTQSYATNAEETARLKIGTGVFDIKVHSKDHRKMGIGKTLFTSLVENLQENGYTQLLIFGAIKEAEPFYDKTLDSLVKQDMILSFDKKERRLHSHKDFFYNIKISE